MYTAEYIRMALYDDAGDDYSLIFDNLIENFG